MKAKIHPQYVTAHVRCTCGNEFMTRATKDELHVEVLALQAEDHYVRVHTAKGSTLLLMRMADAIAELDGQAGMQVHRSWWVARAAVSGAAPTGRRASLILVNGLAVPVARAAMPRARALGLLGVRA